MLSPSEPSAEVNRIHLWFCRISFNIYSFRYSEETDRRVQLALNNQLSNARLACVAGRSHFMQHAAVLHAQTFSIPTRPALVFSASCIPMYAVAISSICLHFLFACPIDWLKSSSKSTTSTKTTTHNPRQGVVK